MVKLCTLPRRIKLNLCLPQRFNQRHIKFPPLDDLMSTLQAMSKPSNSSLVNWSASTFSSLGRHFRLKLNRALAREADNCIFINISGHFVVDLFELKASLALLSVPACNSRATVRLDEDGSSQPKACNAQSDANNSAEVDAH
jgi:hypothetical protein